MNLLGKGARRGDASSALLRSSLAATADLRSRRRRPSSQGETLDYTLTWLKSHRRHRAHDHRSRPATRTTASPPSARSSGGFSRIFKVSDEIETIVDRDDFSTLRYMKRLDERGDKMVEVTTIEDGVATRKRKKIKKVPVPRPVFDPISVIYYFRTLDLAPGQDRTSST